MKKLYIILPLLIVTIVSGLAFLIHDNEEELVVEKSSPSLNVEEIYNLPNYKEVEANPFKTLKLTSSQKKLKKMFLNMKNFSEEEYMIFENTLQEFELDPNLSRYEKSRFFWDIFLKKENEFEKRYILHTLSNYAPIELLDEIKDYYYTETNVQIQKELISIFGDINTLMNADRITRDEAEVYLLYIENAQDFLRELAYSVDKESDLHHAILESYGDIISRKETRKLIQYYQEMGVEVDENVISRNNFAMLANSDSFENDEEVKLFFENETENTLIDLDFVLEHKQFEISDILRKESLKYLEKQSFDFSSGDTVMKEIDFKLKEYALAHVSSSSHEEASRLYQNNLGKKENAFELTLMLQTKHRFMLEGFENSSQYPSVKYKLENALYSDQYTDYQKKRIQVVLGQI